MEWEDDPRLGTELERTSELPGLRKILRPSEVALSTAGELKTPKSSTRKAFTGTAGRPDKSPAPIRITACGWVDAKGVRQSTVPVLEGREFNQRMCMFLEDTIRSKYYLPKTAPPRTGFPQYHLWIHSWEFVPSVMGFATEWLTGEFSAYPAKGVGMLVPEGTYGKSMGLGIMRARCLSTNWGVPNYFHAVMWEHEENSPDKQTLQGLRLVPAPRNGNFQYRLPEPSGGEGNDPPADEIRGPQIPLHPRLGEKIPISLSKLRRIVKSWWQLGNTRGKDRILAVVSNLNVITTHDINLRWTGFPNPKIKNPRTGEAIPITNGKVNVKLGPESFILLWVEK